MKLTLKTKKCAGADPSAESEIFSFRKKKKICLIQRI